MTPYERSFSGSVISRVLARAGAAVVAVSVVISQVGCGDEVSTPEPKLGGDGGEGVTSPGFRCSAQEAKWVEVSGDNFTPLVVGTLEEDGPEISWPAVRLTRVEDVAGNEVSEGKTVTIQAEGAYEGESNETETNRMPLDAGDVSDGGETGLSDTGTSDTVGADTTGGDTQTGDTATPGDTATADTSPSDTGMQDTTSADTGTADTGTRDTGGNRDTGESEDTGPVQDTGGMEDTGTSDDTGGGSDDTGPSGGDAGDDAGEEEGTDRHLVWLSETRLRFKVTPEMNLPGGKYDLTVISGRVPKEGQPVSEPGEAQDARTATAAKAFGILPPPEVQEVASGQPICVEGKARTISIRGSYFMKRDGRLPRVRVGGETFEPTSVGNCSTPGGPFGNNQVCKSIRVEVPMGSVPAQSAPVEVLNFEPAGCHSLTTQQPNLRVLEPAEVYDISPDPICAAGSDHTVTITGEGFLGTESAEPTVEIGDYEATDVQLQSCSELSVGGSDGAELCSEIEAEIAAGEVGGTGSGISRSTVEVTNPGKANCTSTNTTEVTSVAPPSVSEILPQPVTGPHEGSSAGDTPDEVVLKGSRFAQIDDQRPRIEVWRDGDTGGAKTYRARSVSGCSELEGPGQKRVAMCSSLTFVIPEGDFEVRSGRDRETLNLSVTNPTPLTCSSSASDTEDLVLVDPPELGSVTTTPVCSETQDRQVTLQGTDFAFRGGTGPTVAVGMNGYAASRSPNASCTTVAGQQSNSTVEFCDEIRITIPQGDLRSTQLPVTVYNPESVGGYTTETGDAQRLTVVDAPRLQRVEPEITCTEDGSRTLTFKGQGFLKKEPASGTSGSTRLPSVDVRLGPQSSATVANRTLRDCASNTLGVPGTPMWNYRRCETLDVTLAQASQSGVASATVVNPGPADCPSRAVDVTIEPDPTVTSAQVQPQSSCNDNGYRRIEVTGRRFVSVSGMLPEVTIGSTTYQPLNADNCRPVQTVNHTQAQYCTALTVYGKTSDVSGTRDVTVTNPKPLSCTSPVHTVDVTSNCP